MLWFFLSLSFEYSSPFLLTQFCSFHFLSQCLKLLIEVAMEMRTDWAHPLSSAHPKVCKSSLRCLMGEVWPPSLLHLPLLSCVYGAQDYNCDHLLQILLPHLQKEVNLKDSEGE